MTTPDPTAILHDDALLAEARRVLGPGADLQLLDPPDTLVPGASRRVSGDLGSDLVYLGPDDRRGVYFLHIGTCCGEGETLTAALAAVREHAEYQADTSRERARRLRRLPAVAPEPAL